MGVLLATRDGMDACPSRCSQHRCITPRSCRDIPVGEAPAAYALKPAANDGLSGWERTELVVAVLLLLAL